MSNYQSSQLSPLPFLTYCGRAYNFGGLRPRIILQSLLHSGILLISDWLKDNSGAENREDKIFLKEQTLHLYSQKCGISFTSSCSYLFQRRIKIGRDTQINSSTTFFPLSGRNYPKASLFLSSNYILPSKFPLVCSLFSYNILGLL